MIGRDRRRNRRTPLASPRLLRLLNIDSPVFTNEYAGAEVAAIDRVPYDSLTPQAFFDAYVAPRKPVVLVGCVPDH